MEAKACCGFPWLQSLHSFLLSLCSKIKPPTSRNQLSLLFLDTTSHILPDIFYNKVMPLLFMKGSTRTRKELDIQPVIRGEIKTHAASKAFCPDQFSCSVLSVDCCNSQLKVPKSPELLHKELKYSGLWFLLCCGSFLSTLCSSAERRDPEAPCTRTSPTSSHDMTKAEIKAYTSATVR